MKTLITYVLTVIFLSMLTSCHSKSGKRKPLPIVNKGVERGVLGKDLWKLTGHSQGIFTYEKGDSIKVIVMTSDSTGTQQTFRKI
jgi:hypothetical protein